MKKTMVLCSIAITAIFCVSNSYSGQDLTYIDLINSLVDLEQPATIPAQDEFCKQWSSYDRRSYYDSKTGKYINWEANGDGSGGVNWIREENGKYVLGEMNGPGCIWRIWVATAMKGHIRIYLDGSAKPVVDLPCEDYFNCTQEPFNKPTLVHTAANGKNSYIPIPFQKSCKIVADKDYGQYYQFTYTLFSKDTKVPTFKRKLSKEESDALDKVDKKLADCGPDFTQNIYSNAKKETGILEIAPGKTRQLIKIYGAYAITSFKIHPVDMPSDIEQQRQILRDLTLSIYWDKNNTPAVWTPLGDFFGTAPGINLYKALPLGMTKDWFYSNWFMPFANQAVVKIANDGDKTQTIKYEVAYTELKKPADSYARFHAKWHRDMFLPKGKDRQIDWTILTTKGAGRYLGVELEIWNPPGGWWGEGDEKFFIDGEKFPSTFGTGSEDYFGYAWSSDQLFNHPLHNQTINEYNKGHISNNRWQIADNIPFHKSFNGYMEKYFPNDKPTLYSCVVYWYLSANGQDPYKPVCPKNRLDWYVELPYPRDISGITVLEKPVGTIEAEGMATFKGGKWTDDQQLWWIPEKPGNKINLLVNADEKGHYNILTQMTKASDYAIVQFYLNGSKIFKPIDLFNKDDVITTGELNLGTYNFKKGRNIITIEIAGANENAIQKYMVGIDYLKIQKEEISVGDFKFIYDPSVGEKEKWYINDHCFIYDADSSVWHLFGITHAEPANPGDEDNFAHAVSPKLTDIWQKKPFALTVDEKAGEAHLWAPYVIFHNGMYYMYYCGGSDKGNDKYKINLATSKNLYDWQRHPDNPMVVDGYDARDPYILKLKDKWVMYYTATSEPKGGKHIVAAVTSKDLIHWSDRKIVFTDPSIGTWGGPTESPTVIHREKSYYLFIGPRDGYRGTCVYKSSNPFEFKIENLVAKIDSHAAEVIHDTDGKWYISHCGWGQGGVYLARLKWNDGVNDNDISLPAAEK